MTKHKQKKYSQVQWVNPGNLELKKRKNQLAWNFIFTAVFLVLVVAGMKIVIVVHGRLPTAIPLIDLILIVLATFRLIRLFVYDKIMEWFRDFFWDAETYNEDGTLVVSRTKPAMGPRRTLADLLGCPWCFGVWAAFFTVFFYLLIPELAWFIILFLAVAGVGSLLQLFANLVGWRAEQSKQDVMHEHNHTPH